MLYSKEQNKRVAEMYTNKSIDFPHLTRVPRYVQIKY